MRTRVWVAAVVVALALLGLSWLLFVGQRGPSATADGDVAAPLSAAPTTGSRVASRGATTAPDPTADAGPSPALPPGVLARFGWGSGPNQLGRSRPSDESNPEAPMSLSVDRQGRVVVLDNVNGRLVRLSPRGDVETTVPLTVQAPQDVAVAPDGTTVVLDRLVDKSVALFSPDGKLVGELPVEGKNIDEGGSVTGVFADDTGVYVERQHGELTRIGDTKGQADTTRDTVPGRPSRDGKAFLSALIVDAAQGRATVTAVNRPSLAHRFTREVGFGGQLLHLSLLDSDQSGIIYFAGQVQRPAPSPPALVVWCLDPVDGRPLGKVEAPANDDADETFDELAVAETGGVYYLRRTEQSAELAMLQCH